MRRSMIVAAAENGVIGADGQLPWRLPGDLKRFKTLTMGHHLIMGRKTCESIGRPLPGRTTVVLTRDPAIISNGLGGLVVARSIDEASVIASNAGDDEPFVCGGGEVYARALDVCDRVYLTVVERHFIGDAHFSFVNREKWRMVEVEDHSVDELPHRFETWDRVRDG
jgi:dihydrofolate reductase